LTLKSISSIRWKSRIEAVTIKPLRYELSEIYDTLIELSNEMNIQTREAQCLAQKFYNFKFICSTIIWHEILLKVNVVNKMLQDSEINISLSVEVLKDLVTSLTDKRSDEDFVMYVKELAKIIEAGEDFPSSVKVHLRRKTKQFNYEHKDETITDVKNNF